VITEAHPPSSPKPQLLLPLRGDFAPSKGLTDFWVRGVRALAKEANVPESSLALAASDTEIQQEFTKMLFSLLGTVAQQLRYGDRESVDITKDGRFMVRYQIQLCDRFLIVPDEADKFLSLLRQEMVTAISNGSRIGGAWGRIALHRSGELRYVLAPPNMASDPAFVRSEEVE
jgi:hypothetical protein